MRLSVRLALVFAAFGFGISGIALYSHVSTLRAEAYARAQANAEVTMTAVKALVTAQAEAGRLKELGRNLEALVRQSGIASVSVEDAKGRILARRADQDRFLDRVPHPGLPVSEVEDGVYDVEAEVRLGQRGRGLVSIGFHTKPLEARLALVEGQAVQSAVMLILSVAIGAGLIGVWFGGSLERLLPRIESLSRDPSRFRPLPENQPGEVGQLVRAFNRMGASLKAEVERRRRVELERKELAAMLVHDLKTPLTVITSGISLLEDQVKGSKLQVKRTFELLDMSADRLNRMVEDVLQISRLEEVSALPTDEVDLAALARDVAKDFELVAADRKQTVRCAVPEDLALPVRGDARLLRRVFDNLAHNAVEHTPEKGFITLAAMRDAQGRARVEISDSGPGIPPEARAEIFVKFFQKDMKRHVGNVGLGLALCDKVVSRHGGAIGVEDASPKGARFYFTLPLSSGAPARPSEAVL
jgi:signal transduction histidine kinase